MLDELLRRMVGRKVEVKRRNNIAIKGEFRGVWRDSVPYFPDIETPALWITNWGEYFVPFADVASIETV